MWVAGIYNSPRDQQKTSANPQHQVCSCHWVSCFPDSVYLIPVRKKAIRQPVSWKRQITSVFTSQKSLSLWATQSSRLLCSWISWLAGKNLGSKLIFRLYFTRCTEFAFWQSPVLTPDIQQAKWWDAKVCSREEFIHTVAKWRDGRVSLRSHSSKVRKLGYLWSKEAGWS